MASSSTTPSERRLYAAGRAQCRCRDVENAAVVLDGIRVLDLTSSLAGPYCTQLLAALGADVVKVERPGSGDEARAWGPPFHEGSAVMFFAANAGKRSLALDLRSEAGRGVARRLAEQADVLVQSLRPGAVE